MGAGLKTHWLLAELGMSYENPSLDMKAGEHKKPEFMKLNPTGQVPVLIDGDFVLFESLAINQYLAEKAGSDLAGKDGKEKALILQWSLSFSYHPLKHLGVLSQHKFRGDQDEATLTKARESLPAALEVFNKALEGKDYLVGDRFTLAEINIVSVMTYADFVEYDYSQFTNIVRWMKNAMSRSAFIKARGEVK
jgi:glutathione S-transferase